MAKKRKQSVALCDTSIFLEILKGNEQLILAFAKIGEENVAVNP
jgi:predicted nucleic acid-binding protein